MSTKARKPKAESERLTVRERISRYICPMLLGAVLCYAVFYIIYRPTALLYTGIFLGFEILLYLVFDWLKKRRIVGGLIYTAMLFGAVILALNMMWSQGYTLGFMAPVNWFYGEEGVDPNQPVFAMALMIGGGFFIVSVLYYFTQIRYRSLGVMLCTMFPFFIYAKRADIMPDLIVTLIVTLFLAVMVHNRRLDPALDKARRGKLQIDPAYIISFSIFISITGALTMTVDKPTYRSQLERNSDYFDIYDTSAGSTDDYSDLSDQSSSRQGGLTYTNEPIFFLQTNGTSQQYYLRGQAFTYFDGSDWRTYTPNNYDRNELHVFCTENPEYSTDDILADMKILGYDHPENALKLDWGRVGAWEFRSSYLPAPYATVTDDKSYDSLQYRKTDIFTDIQIVFNTEEPQILNNNFNFYEQTPELYQFAAQVGMDGDSYYDWLFDESIGGEDEERADAAERLMDDYIQSYRWYTDDNGISDRLAALAEEITADCETDLEKAFALEQYFTETGFEYTLESIPGNSDVDYFVFESRRGYCAGFATAMTMMARAVDLPARYVEGFAAYEPTQDGNILVRDGHAHAFVEVYIPGAGWLTFDPTVAAYRDLQLPQEDDGNRSAILQFISRYLIVIIVGAGALFFMLFDRMREVVFRIRLRTKRSVRERTVLLYRELLRHTERSSREDHSAYTVKMLREYIARTRVVVPEKLLSLYEPAAFGGYEPSEEEFRQAYREYKACYKYMRRVPSRKTLEKLRAQQSQT